MRRTAVVGVALAGLTFWPAAADRAWPQEPGPDDAQAQETWSRIIEEQGPSHASGQRPELGPMILGNPSQAVVVVRVGLYYSYTATGAFSEFASLHHPFVQVSNTVGAVAVVDRATGRHVAIMQPGEVYDVRFDGAAYAVTGPGGETAAVAGPVLFSPSSPENLFRVESIERTNILASGRVRPLYRGALEVARGASTQAGRVNLLNVLELEDYVRGVVVNESPAFFHAEALKAQATAARGYAVANVGRWFTLGYPFDLVDSASSQVYRGVSAEHPNAVLVTEGTRGLVASYQGQIITAFYSSSFGGHSDSVEWIFNSPSSQLPGTNVTPYLRAIYDGEPPEPDLDNPAGLQSFWSTAQPPTYDACSRVNNRFARWRITVPAATIKARLTAGRYVVVSGDASGSVTGVDVLLRMAGSGRIAVARITLTSGVVDVRGWDNLRRVLGAPAASTPTLCPGSPIPAGFVLNNPTLLEPYTNGDGTFGGVIAYPIDIGRRPGSGPPTLRQEFVSPSGRGTLEIRPSGLKGLRVHINETYDIALGEAELADELVRIDVSPYLVAGTNVVQYNPVGNRGTATVLVLVD